MFRQKTHWPDTSSGLADRTRYSELRSEACAQYFPFQFSRNNCTITRSAVAWLRIYCQIRNLQNPDSMGSAGIKAAAIELHNGRGKSPDIMLTRGHDVTDVSVSALSPGPPWPWPSPWTLRHLTNLTCCETREESWQDKGWIKYEAKSCRKANEVKMLLVLKITST